MPSNGSVRGSKAHLQDLFPTGPEFADLRDAAWDAFVVWNEADTTTFRLVRDEYRRAIEQLREGTEQLPWRGGDQPANRLAEHLMDLYRDGTITLNDPDDLLQVFYMHAPVTVRAHAVGAAGRRTLRDPGISEEVRDRFARLWEDRLSAAEKMPAGERTLLSDEIARFGWWFASGAFEDRWALHQLRRSLMVVGRIEPRHLVVRQLAALVDALPRQVVEVLDLLVERDPQDWTVLGSWQHEEATLARALTSEDAETRATAERVARRLVAQGHVSFRQFLLHTGSE